MHPLEIFVELQRSDCLALLRCKESMSHSLNEARTRAFDELGQVENIADDVRDLELLGTHHSHLQQPVSSLVIAFFPQSQTEKGVLLARSDLFDDIRIFPAAEVRVARPHRYGSEKTVEKSPIKFFDFILFFILEVILKLIEFCHQNLKLLLSIVEYAHSCLAFIETQQRLSLHSVKIGLICGRDSIQFDQVLEIIFRVKRERALITRRAFLVFVPSIDPQNEGISSVIHLCCHLLRNCCIF